MNCQHRRVKPDADRDYAYCLDCFGTIFIGQVPPDLQQPQSSGYFPLDRVDGIRRPRIRPQGNHGAGSGREGRKRGERTERDEIQAAMKALRAV